MTDRLTREKQKGNVLREYDGMFNLNDIDPDLREDLITSRFKRMQDCSYDEANEQARTAMKTIDMMANGEFGFANAAKAAKAYFSPDGVQEAADNEARVK